MAILWKGYKLKHKIFYSGKKIKKIMHNGKTKLWSVGNTVTYNVDTNNVKTEEVDSEETCLEPKTFTPTKAGWNFHGWREDTTVSGEVLPEKIMDDDPITLYAVFKNPIALTYHGNGADSPKHYTWNKRSGCNYVWTLNKDGEKCLYFHYDFNNFITLHSQLFLNNPIYFDESIKEKTQFIVVETDFEVYQPYGDKATGFEFSIRMRHDDPGNIVLKLEQTALYRHISSKVGYKKTADYKQGKNHLKIMIDKSNKRTSYFLNGVLVEGDLPSRNTSNTDVGQIRIYTPAETEHYEKNLYLYNLKVYELNTEGTGTVHVNEDYTKYDEGTVLDFTIGAGGVIDCRTIYYNNGNVVNPVFTLADNTFTKSGFTFAGWDMGAVGNKVPLTTDATATAQWAEVTKEYTYNGNVSTFTVPADGYYQLEVWGAQGGSYDSSTLTGGKGGYSKGVAKLTKGQTLYIVVGGQGSKGGYNGGGKGSITNGGGATHIATSTGMLSALANNKDSILIVAGAGGGSCYNYNHIYYGGSGGGSYGTSAYTDTIQNDGVNGGGGTQTAGGTGGTNNAESINGSFGTGGSMSDVKTRMAGGGGGFYGGASGAINAGGGGGGSGYINTEQLTDTESKSGENEGDGKAKITYIGKI